MKHRMFLVALVLVVSISSLATGFWQRSQAGRDMTKNADAFLASLTEEQRSRGLLEYAAPERVDWHFIPKPTRKGVQVREMNPDQRAAAHALLRSALSQIGYSKAIAIMELEKLLHELEKNKQGAPLRDSERYFVTVFGKPSETNRWGLSVEGHHLSLNFVVEQGKVLSSSPMAFGVNPAVVKNEIAGVTKPGTRILAKEETLAFDLLHALSPEQKKKAVLAAEALKEVRAAGEPHPPATEPEGIAATDLDESQTKLLRQLVETYAANMPSDVAEERLGAINKAGWNKLFFAWTGADQPGTGHYYRIQGPTFLIEFVNTQPDAAGNPANHIHCVWRDPAGDFAITRKAS